MESGKQIKDKELPQFKKAYVSTVVKYYSSMSNSLVLSDSHTLRTSRSIGTVSSILSTKLLCSESESLQCPSKDASSGTKRGLSIVKRNINLYLQLRFYKAEAAFPSG